MPRANRVFVEGGIYHVYNRVSRGERVFSSDDEASAFVELLRKVKRRDGLVVFAWCLMSNHYHLALRTGAVPLSRSMRSLQQMVTRGFNLRHRVYGPLWQGRYKAKLVEDQRYLDSLLAYIHLNPVTAGIVDDPEKHLWTGHREIAGRSRQMITDVDEVLMLFGKTRRTARRAYVRAMKGTIAEPWAAESPGRLPWWKLGRPAEEEDGKLQLDRERAFIDELGRSTGLERPPMRTVEFITRAAAYLEVDVESLAGRGRSLEIVRARELLSTLGVERYGLRVKDLATIMNKSAEATSRMVSRGADKRQEDVRFRKAYDGMDLYLVSYGGKLR